MAQPGPQAAPIPGPPPPPVQAPPVAPRPPASPDVMIDRAPQLAGISGGWSVEPDEVHAFAAAVDAVRRDFEALCNDAGQLADPANRPKLGISPVGIGLADKFIDRISAEDGLLAELARVLDQMDTFVNTAVKTAKHYREEEEQILKNFGMKSD